MSCPFIIHYWHHQTLMPRENKLLVPPARAKEYDQYFIPRHSSDIWIAHVSYLCQLKWIQPIRAKCILNGSLYLVRKYNHSLPPSLPSKPFILWCTVHEPLRGKWPFLLNTKPCMLNNGCFQSPSMVSVARSGMHTFLLSFTLICLSCLADTVFSESRSKGTLFPVCVSGTFWQFLQFMVIFPVVVIWGSIAFMGLRYHKLHVN